MSETQGPSGLVYNDGSQWTDTPRGPNRRLRVEDGSTAFFAGNEFRTFRELDIPTGNTVVIQVVVSVNIILTGIELTLESGQVRAASAVGGTPGGSFSEVMPILARNTMTDRPTPLYTSQVVFTAGGTHTGGTELDVVRLKVETASAAAASVGNREQDARGLGPNTFYIRIASTGVGAATGTFNARWQERP